MFLPAELTPEEIMTHCDFHNKIHKGKALMRISKGIYGLKEVGCLANQQLQQYLDPHSCIPSKHTPSLSKYDATKTLFTLVVDNFGVKHLIKSNDEYLVQDLKYKHKGTELNWEGRKLCGINLK